MALTSSSLSAPVSKKRPQFGALTQVSNDPVGLSVGRQSTRRAATERLGSVPSNTSFRSHSTMLDVRVTGAMTDLEPYRLYTSLLAIEPQESAYQPFYSHIFVLEAPEGADPPDYFAVARAVSTVELERQPQLTYCPALQRMSFGGFELRYAPLEMEPEEHQGLAISFTEYAFRDVSQYVVLAERYQLEQQIDFINERTSEHLLFKRRQPLRIGTSAFGRPHLPGEYLHRAFNVILEGSPRQYLSAAETYEFLDESEGVERRTPSRDAERQETVATEPLSCWDTFESDHCDLRRKCAAVDDCFRDDPVRLASLVARELGTKPRCEESWRNALVDVAEVLDFVDPNDRKLIADSMLRIALKIRSSGSAKDEQFLWAALRTFSAMIAAEDAARLLPFLEQDTTVESRLVALQSICRVFEREPPSTACEYQLLANRAYQIAKKYLDADVFVDGYNAAVAKAAVEAIAVLCDPRLEELISIVASRSPSWFRPQLKDRLTEIAKRWARSPRAQDTRAAAGLDRLKKSIEAVAA